MIILFLAGLAVNRHLQLVRSYAEVEQIVADRTRELTGSPRQLDFNSNCHVDRNHDRTACPALALVGHPLGGSGGNILI